MTLFATFLHSAIYTQSVPRHKPAFHERTTLNAAPTSPSTRNRVSVHPDIGCESWTLRKNEEAGLDAFEMKVLRKILRVSWTAKKTN